jgi:hypothetical protein
MVAVVGGTAEDLLEVLEFFQQVEWWNRAGEFDGGVEKWGGAGRAIDGFGFVNARAEEGAAILVEGEEVAAGGAEVCEAVVEVGAERDADPHFNPSTSCMS